MEPWFLRWWDDSPLFTVSWGFWVILSIVLHELAHAYSAVRAGDPTPAEAGHMTMNPLVHMGGLSLLMFALVGIAWGQTPVNPHNFRRGARDEAIVAGAGPGMNLVLGLACAVGFGLIAGLAPEAEAGSTAAKGQVFLFAGSTVNFALFLFNLIPFPPLDGATVLSRLWPPYRAFIEGPTFRSVALIVFIVVFMKVGPYLFEASNAIFQHVADPVERLFLGS